MRAALTDLSTYPRHPDLSQATPPPPHLMKNQRLKGFFRVSKRQFSYHISFLLEWDLDFEPVVGDRLRLRLRWCCCDYVAAGGDSRGVAVVATLRSGFHLAWACLKC